MKRTTLYLILALVVVFAIAAYAQMGPMGGRPGARPMQDGVGQPPQMGPMPAPPVTMVADGGAIFILRGNQLLKVSETDLKVLAKTELPKPELPKPPADGTDK